MNNELVICQPMNSCDQAAATRVLIGTAHDEEMQENFKNPGTADEIPML